MPNTTPDMMGYKLLQQTIALCALFLVALGLGVLYTALERSQERCKEVQDIRAYIYGATNRSIKSLPTLSYYKAHPDELARQISSLNVQRDEFKTPLDCSLL